MWVSHSAEGTNSGQLRPQLLPRRPRREAGPLPAPSSSQTTPLRVHRLPTTPCRARGQPGHPAQQLRRDPAGRLRLRPTPNRRVESAECAGAGRGGRGGREPGALAGPEAQWALITPCPPAQQTREEALWARRGGAEGRSPQTPGLLDSRANPHTHPRPRAHTHARARTPTVTAAHTPRVPIPPRRAGFDREAGGARAKG